MRIAVALLAGSLAAVPAAHAEVRVSEREVLVATTGARAVVERAPFRITITDGDGTTALRQVANVRAQPFLAAPSPTDPQAGGGDAGDAPVLAAPLTFTVGARDQTEYPTTAWNGNVLLNLQGGVQHSAHDVEAVQVAGDAARLTVGTSDPSRKLDVTVAPGRGTTIRVSAKVTPGDGVVALGDAFETREGEAFRGFGGRHNRIDQRGTSFFNWVTQQNTGAGQLQPAVGAIPGGGGEEYLFPSGPHGAYYVQSLTYGDRFGFLLDRDELSSWRMASDAADRWQVSVAANGIDYVVAPGSPKRAIGAITALSGRHRVPPEWAVGPQLDRAVLFQGDNAAGHEARVRDDLANIDKYDLPLEAYRIEGWQFFDRAKLRELIAAVRSRGIRPMLYFRAFVGKDEIGTDDTRLYDEAIEKGYVAKTPTGQPYVFVSNFNERAAIIDFTNPEAVRWWDGRIREALDLGAEGFMQDFGEQVQSDMVFADGRTGATMHNAYPVLFHRTTREAVERWERESGPTTTPKHRDIHFYTRSGYTGAPAWEEANFPGDETTDWSRSAGLASLTTNMVNRGVGGAFGFSTDIGGYFDIGPYQPTTKELLLRWAEWAALSPYFRLHGSINAGTHVPWQYDEETVRLYIAQSRLHLQARPLIMRLWREAVQTGVPVARPLWLEFPGDAQAAKEDQQWMLGPDVLVAPVVVEKATTNEVYFPRGCWQHPETGVRVDGPRSTRVDAPLGTLPYFFRCGTRPFDAVSAGAAALPRRCASRRAFRIRLRRGLVAARVYVNGRRVRTLRGRRLRARVDLRGLPRGRFTVRVVGRTRGGRTLVAQRRYRTCVPRRLNKRS